MQVSVRPLAIFTLIAMLPITAAVETLAATPQQNVSLCQDGNARPAAAITACTALLQADNGTAAFGDVFYNRGSAYLNNKQYDRAVQDFDVAIKRKPDFAVAFINRGFAHEKTQQYDEALKDYDQALKLDSKSVFSLVHRGDAYAKKEQYQRAIQDYDSAIALAPKSASALHGRGLAKIQIGDKAGGEADIAKATALNITGGK
jgi:tetratricopeptide (TPR) repeat protein